jgi:hypothetical protein
VCHLTTCGENAMTLAGNILSSIAALGMLVCYILVLVQMFQHGKAGIAIVCLITLLCCGGGGLIAFIYGWVKHREWSITNLMTVWTVCLVLWIIGGALAPPDLSQLTKLQM